MARVGLTEKLAGNKFSAKSGKGPKASGAGMGALFPQVFQEVGTPEKVQWGYSANLCFHWC